MPNAISAALAYHTALMIDYRQSFEVSGNATREVARVTSAPLRRLKTSILSEDDDDINDIREEAAIHTLIHRLI